ncbi:TCP11 family protein [Kocuria palustris]|nr:TCP11 family protein [Kocuria palustris]
MNLNNQPDNQESDHQFRPVCFDSPLGGTATAQVPPPPGPSLGKRQLLLLLLLLLQLELLKRVRLDPQLVDPLGNAALPKLFHAGFESVSQKEPLVQSTATTPVPPQETTVSAQPNKKPARFVRRFRSRLLPIINYLQRLPGYKLHFSTAAALLALTLLKHPHPRHHHHHHLGTLIPPLPPINLQSLKEIDLHEILKNPQLRHDILFDPQLQFRPNLDGERGKRKKSIIDKYWLEIQKECRQYFTPPSRPIKINRLPILFQTLRDVLLSLLPNKDRPQVNEIMDIELLVQQLNHGSFDFVEMARWLGDVFKSHCAPMRDGWVLEMIQKFVDAERQHLVELLVAGLRLIFQILEAMKLDVANHQIRILRPVLIGTAVDFEREYFQLLISHNKIYIDDSLTWFYKKYSQAIKLGDVRPDDYSDTTLKPVIISLIIDLLSCRHMATEFPTTLAFDHTRLVLLRADVRQLVCVQLCLVLYRQLAAKKPSRLAPLVISQVQQEILLIVTDDNGNIKWTKNIQAIALQLVKNVVSSPATAVLSKLPQDVVDFAYHWLIKHIQPLLPVYGLMELKVFKDLLSEIMITIDEEAPALAASQSSSQHTSSAPAKLELLELKNIAQRILTLGKFHWSVFGCNYTEYIKMHTPPPAVTPVENEPKLRSNSFDDEVDDTASRQVTEAPALDEVTAAVIST